MEPVSIPLTWNQSLQKAFPQGRKIRFKGGTLITQNFVCLSVYPSRLTFLLTNLSSSLVTWLTIVRTIVGTLVGNSTSWFGLKYYNTILPCWSHFYIHNSIRIYFLFLGVKAKKTCFDFCSLLITIPLDEKIFQIWTIWSVIYMSYSFETELVFVDPSGFDSRTLVLHHLLYPILISINSGCLPRLAVCYRETLVY